MEACMGPSLGCTATWRGRRRCGGRGFAIADCGLRPVLSSPFTVAKWNRCEFASRHLLRTTTCQNLVLLRNSCRDIARVEAAQGIVFHAEAQGRRVQNVFLIPLLSAPLREMILVAAEGGAGLAVFPVVKESSESACDAHPAESACIRGIRVELGISVNPCRVIFSVSSALSVAEKMVVGCQHGGT